MYGSDYFHHVDKVALQLFCLLFQLRATLKEQTKLTPAATSDGFRDHGPFEAVPWVSSATTTSTITTSATSSPTFTTTTSSIVMSTHCPLTWFASVTEKQPKLVTTSDICDMDIQITKKVSASKCDKKTETYSMQTQTPQNLVVSIFRSNEPIA